MLIRISKEDIEHVFPATSTERFRSFMLNAELAVVIIVGDDSAPIIYDVTDSSDVEKDILETLKVESEGELSYKVIRRNGNVFILDIIV